MITGNSKIENRAFYECGVEEYVAINSDTYISEDGVIFNKNKTKMILFPAHKNCPEYRIPEGVTMLSPYVLSNIRVPIIYLPRSLKKISQTAAVDSRHLRLAFYNPELIENLLRSKYLGGVIYLGGPIDDLPEYSRWSAAKGYLYAVLNDIKEINSYKDSYYNYIRQKCDYEFAVNCTFFIKGKSGGSARSILLMDHLLSL